MAQLKDTLILGSARVTDTLYTDKINGGTFTAPVYWNSESLPEKDSTAAYFLAIDAFADGGKMYWVSKAHTITALGLGASGTHADSYFVKALSSTTDNRLIRFDGSAGQILGSRILVTDEGYIKSYNSTRWTLDWSFYHPGASKQVAELYFDSGDATNITGGTLYWRLYSPTSTASNTPTAFHETYNLPPVTKDRTANASYAILTTKNTITTAQGGTGVTSHTANRLVWSTSATAILAGYHYASTTKVAINYTSEPTTNFYVGGNAMINGANAATTTTQSGLFIVKSGTGSNAVGIELYRNSSVSWLIFNTSGNLLINNNFSGSDTTAQTTYKYKALEFNYQTLLATFGGKVTVNHTTPTYAFSISNSEKASIEYNSTNHVLNFIVT